MGGDYETTLHKNSDDISVGSIRIHLKDSEVHFHDDAQKLKCAVPVADFFNQCRDLTRYVYTDIRFYDSSRNTMVILNSTYVTGMLDIEVEVVRVKTSSNFDAFDKFTKDIMGK